MNNGRERKERKETERTEGTKGKIIQWNFRFLLFLIFLSAPSARADFSSSANGVTTADFLNLGVGARAIAMGGAYSAAADDATALYWNPAALTQVQGHSVTLMDAPYVAGSYYDYAGYAQNLGQSQALGAGLQYFSLGSISETDASGESIGTASPYDLAASLGYAYDFSDGIALGVSGKYIEQKIITSASAFAADLGVLSPRYFNGRLRLAAVMQNLGGGADFDGESDPLPTTFKLGGAYWIFPKWLASMDVAAPRGGEPYVSLGTEYDLLEGGVWSFAIRGGYDSETMGSVDGFSGISFGFGLGYRKGSFDYAFVPMGQLGQTQRLSLNLHF